MLSPVREFIRASLRFMNDLLDEGSYKTIVDKLTQQLMNVYQVDNVKAARELKKKTWGAIVAGATSDQAG